VLRLSAVKRVIDVVPGLSPTCPQKIKRRRSTRWTSAVRCSTSVGTLRVLEASRFFYSFSQLSPPKFISDRTGANGLCCPATSRIVSTNGLVAREQVTTDILFPSFDRLLGNVEDAKDKTRKGHLHTNSHNAETSGDQVGNDRIYEIPKIHFGPFAEGSGE
jgi:hypothetical protein